MVFSNCFKLKSEQGNGCKLPSLFLVPTYMLLKQLVCFCSTVAIEL